MKTETRNELLGLIIAKMKTEILVDCMQGRRIPAKKITCFADLHDYVDANEYGGFCDDIFAGFMIEAFGGRDEHEGMPEEMIEFMSAAQNAIDDWIKDGRFNERLKDAQASRQRNINAARAAKENRNAKAK